MNKQTDTRTMLLTASPWQLILSLSLPAILGMAVVGLYNLMDRVFVGQRINEAAMAAVSVSYPFTLINTGVSTLLGVGSASVLSRAVGKKDQATIDKIMGNLIALNILFGAVITVMGMVFTRRLLTLSGAEGEILELAVRYLRIIFAGSLFVNFAQSSNMIMRGEGLLKQAMGFSAGSAVLNILLDPILIAALRPNGMGIEGAAYATVISQILYAVAMLRHFAVRSKNVRIHGVRIETSLCAEIFGVGFSAMLMQVMTLVQQTVLYNAAHNCGGDEWQIILGAALSLQSFAFIPLWGMSQGFQPAVGTNFGAKRYDRVKRVTKGFFLGATALTLVFYLPAELAPRAILAWFIKDAALVDKGAAGLRILFSSYVLLGLVIMSITLMQALGKASKASTLVLLRQIVLFLPLAWLLPTVGGLGVTGVFLAPALTDLAVAALAVGLAAAELRRIDSPAAQEV